MLAIFATALLCGFMKITRRENLSFILASVGAAGLSSCVNRADTTSTRREAIQGFRPLAGMGVIAVQNGKRVLKRVDGFAAGLDKTESVTQRQFTANSPFRVASMSKVAALMTAKEMAKAGVLDLGLDISEAMGVPLRHPKYSDQAVTLQNVLSHRSGISDPKVYWTDPSGDIRSLLSEDMFKGGQPGQWFEYANINYGIAATIMEVVSGERFDQLTARYVLKPLGLDAGFNWAGVSAEKRRNGATLYRNVDGQMTVQTDGPGALTDSKPVLYGDDEAFVFEDYEPGRNGTLLSPQGGLRASLEDILLIAKKLADYPELHSANWIYDGQNGADGDGHFVSFGPGLYVYPQELSPIPGQLMVGHHGEAYGMYGGLWHLPQINAQIVHAVTGTPQPPKAYHAGPPAIAPESRALLDEAMVALGLS